MLMSNLRSRVSSVSSQILISSDSSMFSNSIVSSCQSKITILLFTLFTALTIEAGVNHASYRAVISNFDLSHIRSYFSDSTQEFMTSYERIHTPSKLIFSHMSIRMADSTEKHLEFNLISKYFWSANPNGRNFLSQLRNRPCDFFIFRVQRLWQHGILMRKHLHFFKLISLNIYIFLI